ncbi:MAG: hypothetical protein GXZ01_04165 [Clostridiaceae bacterium]|nr:hypothetical protein [Clostridiaceae bacterium]
MVQNIDSYIAIIGDIRNSKKIKDREDVQVKLRNTLGSINDKYAQDIASRFTITLGDEFQGLLLDGKNLMSIVTEIERKMYPAKIRFGIGIGDIVTDINPELSIGADGPAYHKARQAIEFLRQNERRKEAAVTDIRFETDGGDSICIELINTVTSLITAIKNSWTDRQREAIWDMMEHDDTQANVAKRLGIRQSSLQKHLSGGSYYTYREALNEVGKILSRIRRCNV